MKTGRHAGRAVPRNAFPLIAAAFLGALLAGGPAVAREKNASGGEIFQRIPPRDITEQFPVVAEWSGRGLGVAISGTSFLEDDRTVAERRTLKAPALPAGAVVRERLMFWMSTGARPGSGGPPALVVAAEDQPSAMLRAEHIAWEPGASGVHTALASLPDKVASGALTVFSPAVEPDPSRRFLVCGAGIVVAYAEEDKSAMRRVRIRLGAARLGAHDRAMIRLSAGPGAQLRSLVVAGGHGRAGNGSSILLDGKTVSRKEAWRSGAGHLFDVHAYDLSPLMALPAALEFDTVLQVVFPGLVITTTESP